MTWDLISMTQQSLFFHKEKKGCVSVHIRASADESGTDQDFAVGKVKPVSIYRAMSYRGEARWNCQRSTLQPWESTAYMRDSQGEVWLVFCCTVKIVSTAKRRHMAQSWSACGIYHIKTDQNQRQGKRQTAWVREGKNKTPVKKRMRTSVFKSGRIFIMPPRTQRQ